MTDIRQRSYRWAITKFPTDEENIEDWVSKVYNQTIRGRRLIQYIIAGEEYAPTTNKRHFQVYIETLRTEGHILKKINGLEDAHIEVAKGNREKNIEYCKKDNNNGSEKVIIELPENGSMYKTEVLRARDAEFRQFIEDVETKPLSTLMEKYPRRCFNAMDKILKWKTMHESGNWFWDGELQNKNFWIYGKPGVGKSYWARSQLIEDIAHCNYKLFNKAQNKWWDGYMSQRIVLIEDWDFGEDGKKSRALLGHLKIWGDKYTFNAEIKGGSIHINPGNFFLIVTSNHSIDECFEGCNQVDISAIKRRFKEVEIFSREDIFLQTRLNEEILSK